MSEVDVNGQVLSTFTDVKSPRHLSIDSESHVFVADRFNDRILLLNSQLCLERVLLDRNSQVKLLGPTRLSYNELTSQLHIVHGGYSISCWSVRWLRDGWLLYTRTHSTLLTHLTLIYIHSLPHSATTSNMTLCIAINNWYVYHNHKNNFRFLGQCSLFLFVYLSVTSTVAMFILFWQTFAPLFRAVS